MPITTEHSGILFSKTKKTRKSILDETRNMHFRDNYFLDDINCDAFTFDTECMELNARYTKDAADKGFTGEHSQELGLKYTAKYFPGHQELVCILTDGHNGSENIHTHIVINSVSKYDVNRENSWNGHSIPIKHHLTKSIWHS